MKLNAIKWKLYFFIFLMFCSIDLVSAVTIIKKDTNFASCYYATSDNKTTATFKVYKTANESESGDYNKSYMSKKDNVTIHTINGKNINAAFGNAKEMTNTANYDATKVSIATGECPKYMYIVDAPTNYFVGLYNTDNYSNFVGDHKTAYNLSLKMDYFEMLNSLTGPNGYSSYLAEHGKCVLKSSGMFDICQKWEQETTYSCQWKKGSDGKQLTLNFSNNFKGVVHAGGTQSDGCPSIVYEIIRDGKTYYKFNGAWDDYPEWPEVCTNGEAKCYKHTFNNEPLEYGKKEPEVQSFNFKKVYYYYDETVNPAVFDDNDIVEFEIDGKSDGTIDKFNVILNGVNVPFYVNDQNKFKEYIENFAKTSGTSYFLSKISCDSSSVFSDRSNTILSGYDGLNTSNSNIACAASDYINPGSFTKNTKFYFAEKIFVNTNVSNAEDIKKVIDDIEGLFSGDVCQDKTSPGCLDAQYMAFYLAQKTSKKCQKIYANLNSPSDEDTICDNFWSKVADWAKAGYFGNRVITSGVGGCTGILGSLGVWLSRIYNILKLAVPAIIVAMGFKDFIQGMSSGKDDALKKAGTNFIKRLVVGAVFVMLPLLIKMILTFAFGGSFSDICIDL